MTDERQFIMLLQRAYQIMKYGGVPAHFLMSVNVYTEKMIKYYQNSPWLLTDIVDLKAEQKKTFDEYFESKK